MCVAFPAIYSCKLMQCLMINVQLVFRCCYGYLPAPCCFFPMVIVLRSFYVVCMMHLLFQFGRTEIIWNNLNPDFVKKFVLQYFFEQLQKLKFEV